MMNSEIQAALQRLPAVDEVLRQLATQQDVDSWPHWALVQAIRAEIDQLRQDLLAGHSKSPVVEPVAIAARIRSLLAPSLRPVINATGVVLHTNLGRAPLSTAVLERIGQIAAGYSNLEYDLEQRRRGSRHVHVAEILRHLTGAEDGVVVNNNAAAVLLCLAALAPDQEVVVSRGELIEIGGSFRLPEVMAASGARLREVGTTNRTHLRDYEQAIGPETALLLRAHRSNFAIIGFVAEVEPAQLVALGQQRGVPTLFDLGSGSLVPLSRLGLPDELTVQEAIKVGFDLVTFSGDKLLGGPQAGIIVGRQTLVDTVRAHPLMRPLRPDKMTLAGLQATLEIYRDGHPESALPAVGMLATPLGVLKRRARRLHALLKRQGLGEWTFELLQVTSKVGGGASPEAALPSWAVSIGHARWKADDIEQRLRRGPTPIIGRIEGNQLLMDLRTVQDTQIPLLPGLIRQALRTAG